MEKSFCTTEQHLKETGAKLTDTEIKIIRVDFKNYEAQINVFENYKKRNGKTCYVTDFAKERWVKFDKSLVEFKQMRIVSQSEDMLVSEREETTQYRSKPFISEANKLVIIADYKKLFL